MKDKFKVSVAVMTHPTRIRLAKKVLYELNELSPKLIVDPSPWDNLNNLQTSIEAWRSISPDSTHHLVVQDDVIFAEGFNQHIIEAITAFPENPLAFFSFWGSRNGAAVRYGAYIGAHWIKAVPEYIPSLALLLPKKYALGFVDFAQRMPNLSEADDEVMRHYFTHASAQLMITIPNLVEHAQIRSLVGNDSNGLRSAACFIQNLKRGWLLDTKSTVANIELLPYLREGRVLLYSRKSFEHDDLCLPGTSALHWYKQSFELKSEQLDINIDMAIEMYNEFLDQQPFKQVQKWLNIISPISLWSLWLSGLLLERFKAINTPVKAQSYQYLNSELKSTLLRGLIVGGLPPDVPESVILKTYKEFFPVVNAGISSAPMFR